MTDAVVFDLDGTLIDIPIDYEDLFEEFKRIMRTDNIRPVADVISRVDAETREIVFETWEKAELAAINRISLKPAGSKIYREHANKRRALVTLQGKAIVDAVLTRFKLSFEVVVTREDTLFRSDQLLKAIKQLEVNKRNVLFIGNTEGDENAASEVGCRFIKVK